MSIEIKVPALGESITEATVGQWFKKPGDAVNADEPLVELETDKVTVEVPAPAAGILADVTAQKGATVAIGAVLGSISEGGSVTAKPAPARPEPSPPPAKPQPAAAAPKPVEPARAAPSPRPGGNGGMPPAPSARKMMEEKGVAPEDVKGSGRRGQILKEDVMAAEPVERAPAAPEPQAPSPMATAPVPVTQMRAPSVVNDAAREERVPMSRLRQTIARRLKDAQNTAAMLTTFNDVDMSAVMALREHYKDAFEKRHGVKLGFMGFFVKACVQALREIPAVNAEMDGQDLIYKNYYHIGVAVGTDKGLVVPVVREADRLSLAEIEQAIADFGKRARAGRLAIEDMQGGTFTISNGGVYGSLLSTPILNAPQSGILGMHRIEEKPVVRKGQIVVRPIMNLALSYDHRVVDGKEAVTFLVRVKECLEDPQRFLLDV
ncbi:MAG TPA: 2-oxoglutarate dehydrogenase complex dihydrolipoyllysine-residue succinyltransferase [Hyphomicrobiaceae bacterium]|jgi:2-oxoglutarate dehydrogenase E2 component (dihydrolipoamide succinyltransferase)|nr:2-oxoglutarate dehydrogenase complex dihydrolipoyllysine-residue succinyltransferase [Hyphomicrobiaceae bacterium]